MRIYRNTSENTIFISIIPLRIICWKNIGIISNPVLVIVEPLLVISIIRIIIITHHLHQSYQVFMKCINRQCLSNHHYHPESFSPTPSPVGNFFIRIQRKSFMSIQPSLSSSRSSLFQFHQI